MPSEDNKYRHSSVLRAIPILTSLLQILYIFLPLCVHIGRMLIEGTGIKYLPIVGMFFNHFPDCELLNMFFFIFSVTFCVTIGRRYKIMFMGGCHTIVGSLSALLGAISLFGFQICTTFDIVYSGYWIYLCTVILFYLMNVCFDIYLYRFKLIGVWLIIFRVVFVIILIVFITAFVICEIVALFDVKVKSNVYFISIFAVIQYFSFSVIPAILNFSFFFDIHKVISRKHIRMWKREKGMLRRGRVSNSPTDKSPLIQNVE